MSFAIDPQDVQGIDKVAGCRTRLMKQVREKIAVLERRLADYIKCAMLAGGKSKPYQRRLAYS